MTVFQKLSWMHQMGIRCLCGEQAHPLEKKIPLSEKHSLADLDKRLVSSKSSLSATATHPLGGYGVNPATLMCILESPSAEEDRTGVPLSGSEGDLLKKMLSAIGLDTNIQTYVGYLSPWRAPGARTLTSLETQEGLNLLNERIRAVQPKVLFLLGAPVAQAILHLPLGQARAKVKEYMELPVFTTFAPGFLLKNPTYKKGAWEDLKKLQAFLTSL